GGRDLLHDSLRAELNLYGGAFPATPHGPRGTTIMRATRLLARIALMLASGLPAAAPSPGPVGEAASVPEGPVRRGPRPTYYATGKLHQGDPVKVVKEENGWLAIVPPPRSFSWINGLFIERHGQSPVATVLGDKVKVRVGSNLTDKKPDVESVELPRGSQ